MTIISTNFKVVQSPLASTRAPNLQVPPQEYNYQQQSQLVNQLKIYFTANDTLTQQLVQKAGSLSVLSWLATGL